MKQYKVLLVDDEVNILNSFRRALRNAPQFKVVTAESGAQALQLIESGEKFAVVVSDMQMPNMDGLELLQRIKSTSPNTVRIMLTGNSDQQTAIDAVNIGDIFRFIRKPCELALLTNSITAGVEQHRLIIAEKIILNKTLKSVIAVLVDILNMISPVSERKSSKVLKYMNLLAEQLELPHSWMFEPMIHLSQLGNIIFPDEGQTPTENSGLLSKEGEQAFGQHSALVSELLRKIPRMENIAKNILYQDKCYNGDGVPNDSVIGQDIPHGARMLKLVNDFIRLEEKEQSIEMAVSKLEVMRERYDPAFLRAFLEAMSEYREEDKTVIMLCELQVGMTLNQELKSSRGQLIACKEQKITAALQQIIRHCIDNKALMPDEKVLIMSEDGKT